MNTTNISAADQLIVATRQIMEVCALTALAKAGGNARLLLPHLHDQLRAEFVRGRFVPRVVDRDGVVRRADNDTPMSIDDLLIEMKKDQDFALAFSSAPNSPTSRQRR